MEKDDAYVKIELLEKELYDSRSNEDASYNNQNEEFYQYNEPLNINIQKSENIDPAASISCEPLPEDQLHQTKIHERYYEFQQKFSKSSGPSTSRTHHRANSGTSSVQHTEPENSNILSAVDESKS